MNLIQELKNYCDINNPVGALMLSGEWGCGKTYLIKTKFIPLVEDTYVFVSVSLFGIDSLDKLRVEVKKKWLEKASEIDKLNGAKVSKLTDSYKKIFGTIKDVLPENWQKRGEVVSSIMDLVNFAPISNRMFDKKVILVFDDLERTNIPCADLLGCINDYCENQNFNTIIIANERKIKDKSDNAFSLEMESATINAFKNANNMEKMHFSGWFVGIWGQYCSLPEIERQVTTASLKKLRDDLNSAMQGYKEKGEKIALAHTQNFIKKLDAIIKTENEDTTI